MDPNIKYNLIYMASPIYGGWVTFTAHLSLKNNYNIYKITERSEKNKRNFGYGVKYQNLNINDITNLQNIIICALDKKYYKYLHFFSQGTTIVIHDPTELKTTKNNPNPLINDEYIKKFNIITIRKLVNEFILNKFKIKSSIINHPFYRYKKDKDSMNNYVVSISRIDFDKNTDIILKCNNMIEDDSKKIKIFGKENRLYVHHKLKDLNFHKYWFGKYDKNLPMTYENKDILLNCKFMVDLSTIKNDGGGTQYTFLEAIYNECILILNEEWINKDNIFKHGVNCLSVKNEHELKDILLGNNINYDRNEIIKNANLLLDNH